MEMAECDVGIPWTVGGVLCCGCGIPVMDDTSGAAVGGPMVLGYSCCLLRLDRTGLEDVAWGRGRDRLAAGLVPAFIDIGDVR